MELRELIDETLVLVEGQAPALTTSPPDPVRQFAAAGLMRCCALLRGACVLDDASLGTVAGMLERQHWETWLISMFVLLGGEAALNEVAGDDIHYKRLLSDKLKLNLEYRTDWDGPIGKLKLEQIAKKLGPLLKEAGETGDVNTHFGYDVTYRVQSLFAVHAGLATIGMHISYGDSSWSVKTNPPAPFHRIGLTPALHTLHLAKYVFERFTLPTDPLSATWDNLIALGKTKPEE